MRAGHRLVAAIGLVALLVGILTVVFVPTAVGPSTDASIQHITSPASRSLQPAILNSRADATSVDRDGPRPNPLLLACLALITGIVMAGALHGRRRRRLSEPRSAVSPRQRDRGPPAFGLA